MRSPMEVKRVNFLREVQTDVWERLEDNEVETTLGEIREHFSRMLDDKGIRDEVANIFYNRIIS